jgi:hypothetical protein
MNKWRWANEEGMTLASVLMLLVVLSVLGLGLLAFSVNHAKLNSIERSHQASYYIAEAGVTTRMKSIEDAVKQYYEDEQTKDRNDLISKFESNFLNQKRMVDSFEPAYGEQPNATVTVERSDPENPGEYVISSVGVIGERSRKVEKIFQVNWQDKGGLSLPGEMAVYTNTTIALKGGATIRGNMGTNSKESETISFKGGASHQAGDIFVPNEAINIAIDAPDNMMIKKPLPLKKEIVFSLPPFPVYPRYPVYPDKRIGDKWNKHDVVKNGRLLIDNYLADHYTLQLNENASFSEIKLSSNNTLNINVGDSDKAIVVDHLNVQNGHINITGSGSLTFYVKDEITMGSGSSINNNGNIERLHVYLKGAKKVKLSGSQIIFGSLYAETSDIELTGGGGFQGHIFTGGDEVIISGGARTYSSLLYAPFADFRVTGGGSVKGMILSHSFEAEGGAYAEFLELDLSSVPFGSSGGNGVPNDLISSKPLREVSK